MLKVGMDVAPEPFAFAPLLIIVLAAVGAVIVAIFVARLLRKASR